MSNSYTLTDEDIQRRKDIARGSTSSDDGVDAYGADPDGVFQERFLDNPAVCRNCFRVVRVARECRESRSGRSDVSATKSAYTLHDRNVTVEYVPARTVRGSSRAFCSCGSDSAFSRLWCSSDVDVGRFGVLASSLVRTAFTLGVLDCSVHDSVRDCVHSLSGSTHGRVHSGGCARSHTHAHAHAHAPGCAPAHALARARRGWEKFSSDDFANEQRRGGIADHVLDQALDEAIAVQAARKSSE